jgi:xylan 1,4-beta-xylosidase
MRGPREDFMTITRNGMQIRPYEANIKAVAPVSSLFKRQMHKTFTATTTRDF